MNLNNFIVICKKCCSTNVIVNPYNNEGYGEVEIVCVDCNNKEIKKEE